MTSPRTTRSSERSSIPKPPSRACCSARPPARCTRAARLLPAGDPRRAAIVAWVTGLAAPPAAPAPNSPAAPAPAAEHGQARGNRRPRDAVCSRARGRRRAAARSRAAARLLAERPVRSQLRATAVHRQPVRLARACAALRSYHHFLFLSRDARRSVRALRRGSDAAVLGGALPPTAPARAGRGDDRGQGRSSCPSAPIRSFIRATAVWRVSIRSCYRPSGRSRGWPRTPSTGVRPLRDHRRSLRRPWLRAPARRLGHQPTERFFARRRHQARGRESNRRRLDGRSRPGTRPTSTRSDSAGTSSCRRSISTSARQRQLPVLGHFSLGVGLLRADVSGGGPGVGGVGIDYYDFADYLQLRYYPVDWLFLQYRAGLRTFDNRRALILDQSRLTSRRRLDPQLRRRGAHPEPLVRDLLLHQPREGRRDPERPPALQRDL